VALLSPVIGHYRNAVWSDLKGGQELLTLPEAFESGLRQARHKPFLGHREVLSTDPITYGDYTWQTYSQVDKRRRAIGSALNDMFISGRLTPGEELRTVGIWSVNRPGKCIAKRSIPKTGS
jgi:long-chain acyl-CoA synthetase